MKCLVAVVLSVLATAIAGSNITTELTSLEANFFDKFLGNKDFGAVVDNFLKHAAEDICKENNTDLRIPFKEVIKRATEIDQKDLESMTVCTLVKTKLIYVTEPMVTTIDGCVWDNYAGIADFLVNVYVSAFNTICDYRVEEYLELFNPCAINADYFKCIEDGQRRWGGIAKDDSKHTFQQKFYRIFSDMRPCVEEATKKNCKLEITQKAVLGAMDSVLVSEKFGVRALRQVRQVSTSGGGLPLTAGTPLVVNPALLLYFGIHVVICKFVIYT